MATLLPTGVGGLAAWTAVIGLSLAAVLAAGLYEPALASLARISGPRFARSIAALRDCLDPRLAASLSGWLAQLLLLASAVVAFVVRFMRRHRRDDFRGRYRAWGWLGWLLVVTACCTQVPVGRVVGVAMSEATGIVLGPSGFGWWVAIAAPLLAGVALWAVLPLHERLATGLWLAAGLLAWAGSAAVIWSGTAVPVHAGTAPAAWVAGSGLVMIALLAAARSVIREVRGTAAGKAATAKGRPASDASGGTVPAALAEDEDRQATGWLEEATSGTDYTDGSDVDEGRETRHLSKAERKRLKRLARMNRVA